MSFVIDERHAGNRPRRSGAEARQFVDEMDPQARRARTRQKPKAPPIEQTESGQELHPETLGPDSEQEADSLDLKAALLARLHALTPRGFEDFVVHLLKSYGMELVRTGGQPMKASMRLGSLR